MSKASAVGVFIKVLQIHLRRHWRSLLVRLVVTSGLSFGLFCLLLIGVAANVASRYEIYWWEELMCAPCTLAAFSLALWPPTELLPPCRLRNRSYGLLLWLTIPGFVAAGPAWFCGFPSMWTPGDGPIVLRLMVSVIPIALAAAFSYYIHNKMIARPEESEDESCTGHFRQQTDKKRHN